MTCKRNVSEIGAENIPSLSVDKTVKLLVNLYSSALTATTPLKTLPSVMLWGPPGVGKSQAVRQIAERIEGGTGKSVAVTDVRLLLFNPIDLRGIPTANADKTLAIWLRPKLFDMDESEDKVNILFLDEISAAPPSVQAAAYQITLDRVIGEHRLPDNCIVIAAGNRVTDKSVAYKMPKALANRLLHLNVTAHFSSWKAWALAHGIHETVIGFLSFRQNRLMGFERSADDLAFATPRSWEMVSRVLEGFHGDVEAAFPLIAGLVGNGVAAELRTWTRVYDELPDVEAIFRGKAEPVPQKTDALYALTSSMSAYARNHHGSREQLANSIRYALKLPPDFSYILLKDYLSLEKDFPCKLLKIPEFVQWMNKQGRLLDGAH